MNSTRVKTVLIQFGSFAAVPPVHRSKLRLASEIQSDARVTRSFRKRSERRQRRAAPIINGLRIRKGINVTTSWPVQLAQRQMSTCCATSSNPESRRVFTALWPNDPSKVVQRIPVD